MYLADSTPGVGTAVDWGSLINAVGTQFLAERQAKIQEAAARRQLALEKAQRRQSLQALQNTGTATQSWLPLVLAGGAVLAVVLLARGRK